MLNDGAMQGSGLNCLLMYLCQHKMLKMDDSHLIPIFLVYVVL